MKSYLKIVFMSVIMVAPFAADAAGFIAQDTTVTAVTNTSSNVDQFKITTSGGTGVCANQQIFFKPGNTNSEAYTRAFVVAMTAITSDLKVDVYSYGGNTCAEGAYISVKK